MGLVNVSKSVDNRTFLVSRVLVLNINLACGKHFSKFGLNLCLTVAMHKCDVCVCAYVSDIKINLSTQAIGMQISFKQNLLNETNN